ncbi:hypothetical protein GY45DRAFT_915173 [Cubamyces sp. BRFM 1775]|nr:hypothetical protein GY45DRAFT_915173 [Cubamyces sp. BRFM 1775]
MNEFIVPVLTPDSIDSAVHRCHATALMPMPMPSYADSIQNTAAMHDVLRPRAQRALADSSFPLPLPPFGSPRARTHQHPLRVIPEIRRPKLGEDRGRLTKTGARAREPRGDAFLRHCASPSVRFPPRRPFPLRARGRSASGDHQCACEHAPPQAWVCTLPGSRPQLKREARAAAASQRAAAASSESDASADLHGRSRGRAAAT